MKFYVKLLAIVLVLVTFSTQVASCAFPSFNIGTTDKNTSTDNVVVIPPNSGENGENSGNHVGGAVVENVTAPYIADVYVSAPVEPDESNRVPEGGVNLDSSLANAIVPGGVKLEDGSNEVALTINGIEDSKANVELLESEVSSSFDVHVSGVALDNIVPMEVKLTAAAVKGLNSTSIKLYHVENGETIEMTLIPNDAEFTAHNQFKYDPATGDVTLYIASFSEFAIVANTDNAWTGGVDHSWYKADATELVIANAEQLWSLSQIVGGMNGQTPDSFAGKTIKLIADINLGDKESENNPDIIFYPIGYYNSEGTYERTYTAITSGLRNFEGTFDGNGHTIANFYQNTWEMKGDHNWYSPEEQYYRDGMGLFGRVYGGTVKNLTVENFSSDGEIATTGVIAAYSDGATFQNISIFNCNPRVYNIGNGGIVGCVGWYAKEAGLKTYFTNITVDNTNIISALWGSYDVACGGIVGQYYPTSGQTSAGTPKNGGIHFENCHVSAVMDVYNDVCANYQYYAYRYTGMFIGSVRENKTIDGRVYPDMTGITATSCTVHFGTWNDYYYCELVANTTASYTHDHQMSRLTQVAAVNGTTITPLKGEPFTVPAEGRYNYVVVTGEHASENATCYHFVDGAVWNHEDAGYHNGENGEKFIDENGDSIADLKEDKQHIYLEFNNLFTGYGWGVTSYGIENLSGINNMDIILADGIPEGSVEKFEKQDNLEFETGSQVHINEIFKVIENSGVEIKNEQLIVTVSAINNSTAKATWYTGGTWEDGYISGTWEDGYIVLEGVGQLEVTITDYFLCKPTTVTINVTPTDKFEYKYGDKEQDDYKDFLLRVGNQNTISLELLFDHIQDKLSVDDATVNVTVNTDNSKYTFTHNASNWKKSTLKFNSFTGVVTITIQDATSNPCSIPVEVVNATNATSATSATSNNVVLLKDVSGTFSITNGNTLYGNGFTVTLPTNSIGKFSAGFTGYITLTNGNLDNVRIEGPVYPEMYIYRDQAKITDSSDSDYGTGDNVRYFNNSVLINGGNVTISNSYISGSRTPLCIRGGNNVVIENTTLAGGSYANMQIAGASTVTLRNLITVQVDVNDSYGKGKKAHGLGIAVDSNVVDIYVEGKLNQYNWINETQWTSIVPSSYQSMFPDFFGDSKYSKHWHYLNGGTDPYVNLAFIFACNWDTSRIHDNRTLVDYGTTNSTIAGVSGGVYSKLNTVGGNSITSDHLTDPGYISTGFNPVAPSFTFDNTINHDEDDSNDAGDTYCVYDENTGVLKLGLTGNNKVLDLSGITITSAGTILSHSAYINGTQINGNSVTVDVANGTSQTLTVKVTSTDMGYDKNGNPIEGSIEYSWNIKIEVATLSYPAPEWDMGGDYQFDTNNCYYVYYSTSQGYGEAVPIYEGIKIKYYDTNGTEITKDLSGTTTIPTGSANSNANSFTCTFDDGSVLTMKFATGWKSGATTHQFANYSNKIYIYPQSLDNDNYIRAKTTNQDFNVQITYTFTDPNGQSTAPQTMQWYNAAASNGNVSTEQWKNFDTTNGKKPSTCLTGDTLITLADGTQKRIDAVTTDDMLLVWNHFTGNYEAVPAAIIFNHGFDNNTVIKLNFSDGTQVKMVNLHQFFDADLNKYVSIDATTVADYVGHNFVKQSGDSYTTVTLDSFEISEEYIEAYGIISALHYNILVEGMFSTDFMLEDYDLFNYFAFGEGMMFDAELMQNDIEKYGLYTYEDFADYLTYEQFVAFNVQYFKISVAKGHYTYEGILDLISEYLNK